MYLSFMLFSNFSCDEFYELLSDFDLLVLRSLSLHSPRSGLRATRFFITLHKSQIRDKTAKKKIQHHPLIFVYIQSSFRFEWSRFWLKALSNTTPPPRRSETHYFRWPAATRWLYAAPSKAVHAAQVELLCWPKLTFTRHSKCRFARCAVKLSWRKPAHKNPAATPAQMVLCLKGPWSGNFRCVEWVPLPLF